MESLKSKGVTKIYAEDCCGFRSLGVDFIYLSILVCLFILVLPHHLSSPPCSSLLVFKPPNLCVPGDHAVYNTLACPQRTTLGS